MRVFFVCLLLSSGFASADERSDLIAEIVEAATHAHDDERHEIEIDGCQITTFRWKELPDTGWTLWSSFRFDMADGELSASTTNSEDRFVYMPIGGKLDKTGIALVVFTMRDGTFARFERSNQRKQREGAWPSPRGDGTSHYFEKIDNFFFRLQGNGELVESKARSFTTKYLLYIREYCQLSS